MRILLLFLLLPFTINAQELTQISESLDQPIEINSDLSNGVQIDDLSWAWSSSNACFVSFQQHKFNGSHVFFEGVIPVRTEIKATVIPDNPEDNFSIYAFETPVASESLPPNLASCIRCEADYKWDRKWVGKTQDHTRTVKDLLAINRPYRVVIAVVGAEGLTEGGFTLKIEPVSR